jgi:hypothetical protein
MATTTTNFGWDIPQSTDLVKDGATAIAALGQDIDTALVDLKGGTTGQVLAKASGTDLDFSWVAQDDSNAIQNAIVDAKGDLIGATAADTPARLAVGTNGQVLTADSTAATGLAWATPAGGAGMTVLASGSLPTGAGVLTLSGIVSTYNNLKLVIRDHYPATDNVGVFFTCNNDQTSNVYNLNFTYQSTTTCSNGGQLNSRAFASANYNIDNGNFRNALTIDFYDYTNTTANKLMHYVVGQVENTGANYVTERGMVMWNAGTPAAIDRIDFGVTSGNWAGGTYILYGVK